MDAARNLPDGGRLRLLGMVLACAGIAAAPGCGGGHRGGPDWGPGELPDPFHPDVIDSDEPVFDRDGPLADGIDEDTPDPCPDCADACDDADGSDPAPDGADARDATDEGDIPDFSWLCGETWGSAQPPPSPEPGPACEGVLGLPDPPGTQLGGDPRDLALGDLDGDGFLDAVIATHCGIDVLPGAGRLGFRERTSRGSVMQPTAVAITDLDGDGRPDVVASVAGDGSGMHGPVFVYRNGPDGLDDGTTYPVDFLKYEAGNTPGAIAAADFDGDGHPDVAIVDWGTKQERGLSVALLMGAGDGTLGPPLRLRLARDATNPHPGLVQGRVDLVAVDLDGDSRPDLAVASPVGTFVVLGPGGTTPQVLSHPGAGTSVAASDLDGDSLTDLAVAGYGEDLPCRNDDGQDATCQPVRVFLNEGSGLFHGMASPDTTAAGQPRVYPAGTAPRTVAIGDLDGDGRQDLAVGEILPEDDTLHLDLVADRIQLLRNLGGGDFDALRTVRVGWNPVVLAVADVDGDGRQDLVNLNDRYGKRLFPEMPEWHTWVEANTVEVHLNPGSGNFGAPPGIPVSDWAGSLAIGDFNRDGHADVAITDGGAIELLLGRGDATFDRRTPIPIPGFFDLMEAGDFDADGDLDLAIGGAYGVAWLRNEGDGTLSPPYIVNTTIFTVQALATVDIDLDGWMDVFGIGKAGTFVARGTPQGLAEPVVLFGHNGFDYDLFLRFGDLDRRGGPDLVIGATSNPQVGVRFDAFCRGQPGTFHDSVQVGFDNRLSDVALGDLDGDGWLDIVSSVDVDVQTVRNRGGFFDPPQSWHATVKAAKLVVDDFRNRRRPDVLAFNPNGSTAVLLANQGDGSFRPATFFPTLGCPLDAGAADFDEDGQKDVLLLRYKDPSLNLDNAGARELVVMPNRCLENPAR